MTERFLHGHLAFQKRSRTEREYLHRLAIEGQKPKALYIGCSDSRVVPELLTGSTAGELFVVRNIANHVPHLAAADSSVGAAIDYAVGVLGVEDVIVCGHTGCGGVRAALDGVSKLPKHFNSLREWVSGIVPTVEGVRNAGHEGADLFERSIQENVLESLDNLLSYDAVAGRIADGTLGLHAWIYDIESLAVRVYDAEQSDWADARSFVDVSHPGSCA